MTISLPESVAKKVDNEAQKHGFATRSEFIRDLLRKYFAKELTFEEFERRPLDEIKYELSKTGKYNQEFIESVVNGLKNSSKYAR